MDLPDTNALKYSSPLTCRVASCVRDDGGEGRDGGGADGTQV